MGNTEDVQVLAGVPVKERHSYSWFIRHFDISFDI